MKALKLTGTHGWIGLGAVIVAWELRGPELLSEAVDRALARGGAPRALTVAAVVLTGAHLLNALPNWADPWHLAGRLVFRPIDKARPQA